MPFDIGFNFRANSGSVVDGTNEFRTDQFSSYPTTFGTTSAGFVSSTSGTAYTASETIDRRLAGYLTTPSGITEYPVFRVDLPGSGNYDIILAMGDPGHVSYPSCEILDSDKTSILARIGDGATPVPTAGYMDASGGSTNDSVWVDYPRPLRVRVSGSAIFFRLGRKPDDTYVQMSISHIRVTRSLPTFRRTLSYRTGSRRVASK